MTCGIYQFWCGPYFYVGRSVNIERRWKKHQERLAQGDVRHVNPKLRAAFNKHGWTGQDILVECEPHQNEKNEQHFIDLYRGTKFCLNASPRAEGGGPAEHSEESKAKMSAVMREVHARPGQREKKSAAHKAAHARPGAREKLSEAVKAAHARPGAREKLSEAAKEAAARPGARDKRSAAAKEVAARPGQRERMSAANREAQNRPGARDKNSEALKRYHDRQKAAKLEAELADIPEADIISMFEVTNEEA